MVPQASFYRWSPPTPQFTLLAGKWHLEAVLHCRGRVHITSSEMAADDSHASDRGVSNTRENVSSALVKPVLNDSRYLQRSDAYH